MKAIYTHIIMLCTYISNAQKLPCMKGARKRKVKG
jgi:hypothetical protein